MHYYTFKAKDYISKTAFLEPLEDLAYRRMLDHCYLTEKPLPEDIEEIAMLIRMRTHCDCIKTVLHYFFELTPQGYVNDFVARELLTYYQKSQKAKASAEARWNKERNKTKDLDGVKVQCEIDANALQAQSEGNANHKPLTNNQEPLNNKNNKSSGNDDLVIQVFEYWQKVFNKPRTKLDAKRKTKIKARLADGRTITEIQTAIDNCSKSEFHVVNGHIDVELICRDDSKFESFLSRKNQPVNTPTQNQNQNGFIDFSNIGQKPKDLSQGDCFEHNDDNPF